MQNIVTVLTHQQVITNMTMNETEHVATA
jgi:hypothetical protein